MEDYERTNPTGDRSAAGGSPRRHASLPMFMFACASIKTSGLNRHVQRATNYTIYIKRQYCKACIDLLLAFFVAIAGRARHTGARWIGGVATHGGWGQYMDTEFKTVETIRDEDFPLHRPEEVSNPCINNFFC
jgi:hypothetical protein